MKKPSACTLDMNEIAKLLSGLRDAHNHRFLKKEDLAGPATELNTSVLTHLPLCVASGNELADIFHHQRFHRIGIARRYACNASGVGTVKAAAAFLVAG